ncbi:C39 family peptidase [Priestia taiwanensis]|uniref:Peptidase C39-like domain-containing protein n=1 Tax=Priestia taiwanensis TaxID=1347902 RepID=A0A917AQR3_9BACI|nr:C39 family peptidase [Priestia taiwanensis]MBM7362571.1 uncharacterized protein YvpB [Priestia taiwanensis]GGE63321.1 hypothetical protein GCM10007140_11970 [Priestia taiwanensis]
MKKLKYVFLIGCFFIVAGCMDKGLSVFSFLKSEARVEGVPLILQNPELPRGCEVTSLSMLLHHAGVPVSKMELAKNIKKVPFEKNGLRGDLNEGFVGDMYSKKTPGLGVYAGPVYELGLEYLPDQLINLTGKETKDLYRMLDKGYPVWVITNATFAPLKDNQFETWNTKSGKMRVTYHEHSVVMTGYDDEYVYINDPLDKEMDKKVPRKQFEEAWVQMGKQAISYEK